MNPICHYCQNTSERVTGKEIYPHREDLFSKFFYRCVPCNAYVGCHTPGSYEWINGKKIAHKGTEPLGILANQELRRAKNEAHKAFDMLWKSELMTRKAAYAWLSEAMNITPDQTHIGMFSVERCNQATKLAREKIRTCVRKHRAV